MRWCTLVVAALVAAGCGAADVDDPARVAEAARRAATEDSFRVAFTIHGESEIEGDVEADGTADVDRARRRGRTRYTGRIGDDRFAEDTIYIGDDVYTRFTEQPPAVDEKWTKSTAAEAAGTLVFAPLLRAPDRVVERLGRDATDVRGIDREQVRGVDTSHYRGRLDAAGVAAVLGDGTAELTEPATVDFWVDDDGRLRQLDLDAATTEGDNPFTVSLRFELFDFGAVLDIDAPAPAEVGDETRSTLVDGACTTAAAPITPDDAAAVLSGYAIDVADTFCDGGMTVLSAMEPNEWSLECEIHPTAASAREDEVDETFELVTANVRCAVDADDDRVAAGVLKRLRAALSGLGG